MFKFKHTNSYGIARIQRALYLFVCLLVLATGVFSYTRVLTPTRVEAAPSSTLNFQARLYSSAGNIVPDGNYHIEFKLYDSLAANTSAQGVCSGDSSTDDCLWVETRSTGNLVQVKGGYFSVNLGDVSAFPTMNWDQDLYLTMNIGGAGGAASYDGEMTPRIKLTSVPYAFQANYARQLQIQDSGFTGTLGFASPLTDNRTIDLPDASGTVILDSTLATTAFIQNGNSFGQAAVLGANDEFDLELETNSTTRLTIDGTTGNVTLTSDLAVNGGDITSTGNLIISATGYVMIGDDGTANFVDGDDDLYVQGDFEVDGSVDFAATLNVTGNATIGTGSTLSIAGGNTASVTGIAAPTAGMLYYDTTTNQLLTYNGTKWIADKSESTIVAASDSTQAQKYAADYVADGTSDEDEINAALTAAAGGKVYLLPGTYVADGTILIPNNTTLAGAGNGTVVQLADIDATDNLIENSDTATGTGVVIRDLALDGQNDLNGVGTQNGISLNGMGDSVADRSGAKIVNINAYDFRTSGISSVNSSRNLIQGNTVSGSGGVGISIGTIAEIQNIVDENTLFSNTGGGIQVSSSDSVVSNNSISGGTMGISIDGDAQTIVGNNISGNTTGIFASTDALNGTISNNYVESVTNGVYLFGTSNMQVTNNTIKTAQNGVYLMNGSQHLISGNTITDATTAGIRTAKLISGGLNDSTISNNRIHNSGGATANNGIFLDEDDDNNVIINNTITDTSCTTTCYAIFIENASSTGNYLAGNKYSTSVGAASIQNNGTSTIYGGQSTGSNGTDYTIQPAGDILLNADTEVDGELTVTGNGTVEGSLTVGGSGELVIDATGNLSTSGTITITNATTDITSGSNEDLTIIANGTGEIILNDSVQIATLIAGSASDTLLCRNGSNQVTDCGNTTLSSYITLQNAYNNGNTITTTDGRDISFTLVDTATDANFLVDIATGSAGRFAVQSNGTDVFAVDATSISLNQGVTVAAGQTLKITGGNTASVTGIASPEAGMLFYDTDTNQLLIYNGTKWMADKSESVIVAPNGASDAQKYAADYVASATSAETEINTALTAAAGGKVYLLPGTYVADGTILIPNNTTLAGAGNGTVVQLDAGAGADNLIEASGTDRTGQTVRDLTLDGSLGTDGTQWGIYFDGVGAGSGASARDGAVITNVKVTAFEYGAVNIINSANSIVSLNSFVLNDERGLYISASSNSTISNNLIQGNGLSGVTVVSGASYNTFTANTIEGNSDHGLYIATNNNTVTGNVISNNSNAGVRLNNANGNVVSGNNIANNGGATANSGVYTSGADENLIVSNSITDTQCDTTCYAIDISNAASDNNYLADNYYTDTDVDDDSTINDAGTGTIYGGQQTGTTNDYTIQPAGDILLNADTEVDGELTVTGNGTVEGSLTVGGSGELVIDATGNLSTSGTITITNATTDITSGSNEDLTIIANGTGEIILNDSVQIATLIAGSASDTLLCRNGSNQVTDCGNTTLSSYITLQNAYNNGNTITTTDGRDISFTLVDTATDANFLVDIATGSAGRFAVQSNGTDVFAVDATTVTVDQALTVSATSNFTANMTISNNANFSQTGTGTFSTGTGDVSLNGDTTITTGNDFVVTDGTATFGGNTEVNGTNTFTVGTGLTTLGGNLTVQGSAIDFSNGAKTVSLANVANAINFDSNTFTIDALNNRVGIGTAAPSAPLHVATAASIATLLESSSSSLTALAIRNTGGGDKQISFQDVAANYFNIGVDTSDSNKFKISSSSAGQLHTDTRLTITSGGNVGIGTTAPSQSLSIGVGTTNNFNVAGATGTVTTNGGYVQSGVVANTLTGATTISPTANSAVALTVNGTAGTAATALSVVQSGNATAFNVAGSGTGNLAAFDTTNASANGISIDVQSSTSSQYVLNVTANNGSTNALYVRADGRVGVGNATPGALFSVGSTSQFQVNATGEVTYVAATGDTTTQVCRNSAGQLADCYDDGSGTGLAFVQGGNSFNAVGVLGTDDTFGLEFKTDGTTAISIDTSQNTTFSGNVVLAASQTLTLTGDTTANRPAGTAGELYYDTDTNTLLTYNGTKWIADRGEYTIVAASDSSQAEKDSADYVADGTADQTEINNALTAASGGKVLLLAGTYVADGTILIPNNTTLSGTGNGTVVQLVGAVNDNLIENSDTTSGTGVTIRDIRLDGSLGTGTNQRGIALNNLGAGSGSSARSGGAVMSVIVEGFEGTGIRISASNNNLISGNVSRDNTNGFGVDTGSSHNTIVGNISQGNDDGFAVGGSYNTFANNTVQGNTASGFNLSSTNNNVINGNTVADNGAGTANNGIVLTSSDNNKITNNYITDTQCDTTCYAINIDADSDNNYLADNHYTDTDVDDDSTINDAGTGTIYGGQQSGASGDFTIQPAGSILLTGDTDITGALSVTDGITIDGAVTDITTGTNQDLTVIANGTGIINLNDTVRIGTLGAVTGDSATVCRDTVTGLLTACDANTTGTPFLQGGNSFGDVATLGTNDTEDLNVITDGNIRFIVQADGDIAFNTDTLFVDAQDGQVGIGTATPNSTFDVVGTEADGSYVASFQNTTAGGDIIRALNSSGANIFEVDQSGSGHAILRLYNGSGTTIMNIQAAGDSHLTPSAGNGFSIGTTSNNGAKLEVDTDPAENLIALLITQDDTTNNNAALRIDNRGTGNSLEVIDNGTATPVLGIGATGNASFQNSTDQANAFQILNAAGDDILSVDTTDRKVIIGDYPTETAGSITGQLQVRPVNDGRVGIVVSQFSGSATGDFIQGRNSSDGQIYFAIDASGGAVFNEQGFATGNFRVEGDTNNNLLYADAANDRVSVGDATPDYKFEVQGTSGNGYFGISSSDVDTANIFSINSTGRVFVGTVANADVATSKLYVEGDTQLEGITRVGNATNYAEFAASGQLRFTGTARNSRQVLLAPEFSGATLTGDGTNNVGVMTSDFCSNSSPAINTGVCAASNERHNYYNWTANATNDYSIFLKWRVPSDYSALESGTPIQFYGTRSSSSAGTSVTLTLLNSATGATCGVATPITNTTAWTITTYNTTGCTLTKNQEMIWRADLSVGVNAESARMGEIYFNYLADF